MRTTMSVANCIISEASNLITINLLDMFTRTDFKEITIHALL